MNDDEIQNAIDISNLSDEQILELYNDVMEFAAGDLIAGCYCLHYTWGYQYGEYRSSCTPGTYYANWYRVTCTKR